MNTWKHKTMISVSRSAKGEQSQVELWFESPNPCKKPLKLREMLQKAVMLIF